MLVPSSVAKVLQRAKGRRCVLRCQVVDYADLYQFNISIYESFQTMSQVYFWHKKMHHELNHNAKLLIALNTKKDKFSVSDVCRMYSELVGRILSEEFILMLTAQSKIVLFSACQRIVCWVCRSLLEHNNWL